MLEKVVGSKVRAAIFTVLFTEQHRVLHIREMARMAGLTAPSLMRELRELAKIGLVRQEKDGNRVKYSASQESPLYGSICELVRKAEGGMAILFRAFADSDNDVAFVYGSRAKGTARADSDYDVFVIGNEGLRKTVLRLRDATDKLGVEVNPSVVSRAEFERRIKSGDHFLSEVMSSPKIFLKGSDNELTAMA